MQIAIVNGPNLNLLGTREPNIYGSITWADYYQQLQAIYPNVQLSYFQSNEEGALITYIQNVNADALIINPGGFSHTSVALRDALILWQQKGCVEVHISNVYQREWYRHNLITATASSAVLTGFGLEGYTMAVGWLYGRNNITK
jgi:3-dehydroquinate dehydratase II